MTPIQVYGQFSGHWSHAGVCRGIVRGLALHKLRVQIWNAYSPGQYEDVPDGVEVGHSPEAPVGLFIGGYPPQALHWLDRHETKIGLFITESHVIPRQWAALANACDLVVVPSEWCREAYTHAGVPRRKLLVVPHGVASVYAKARPRDLTGHVLAKLEPLRFLHIAGAADFLPRKGTDVLITAFKRAFREGEAVLTIRTPPTLNIYTLLEAAGLKKDPRVVIDPSDRALPPGHMRALLAQAHCLVQPSRAEAFGIVPVEARCVGLPVILTNCTGHAMHVDAGDIIVNHGPYKPIAVQGIPNGTAPAVTADAVESALCRFADNAQGHIRAARDRAEAGYITPWSWAHLVERLARDLKRLCRKQPRSLDDDLGVG